MADDRFGVPERGSSRGGVAFRLGGVGHGGAHAGSARRMTTADAGHASRNSTDWSTGPGTPVRSMGSNPNRRKYGSASPAPRLDHCRPEQRASPVQLEPDRSDHLAGVLRHQKRFHGGRNARRRQAGGFEQRDDCRPVRAAGLPDGHAFAPGFRARMNAPITQPPTSRASTSLSRPAPARNALASSSS